jgi:uncharacterized protein YjbI with pentapeptide repeats
MDTKLNIPTEKKVVSVEILHLDELGYGPQGKHTRREWRAECLDNLRAGKDAFATWQKGWLTDPKTKRDLIKFECVVTCEDGKKYKPERPPLPRTTLDFSGHTFGAPLYANDLQFLELTDFYFATFKREANFNGAKFAHIDFDNTTFEKYARFNNVIFEKEVIFCCTQFIDNVEFTKAVFNHSVLFGGATFNAAAVFVKTKFKSLSLFNANSSLNIRGAVFKKEVSFESAEFNNIGHFDDARFEKYSPCFRGCQIDGTRLEFSDDNYFPKGENSENAIKNISFLKRLADEHGQTDQALNFNAMELRSKLSQTRWKMKDLSILKKLISADYWYANSTELYDKFSDFGRSFTRPLKWYIFLLCITLYLGIVHSIVYSAKDCENETWYLFTNLWREQIECVDKTKIGETKIPLSGWRAAFEYTSYRASGILDFADVDKQTIAVANRLFDQPIEPWWMRIWGVFKAIASSALLFLVALGLRNKYRIK